MKTPSADSVGHHLVFPAISFIRARQGLHDEKSPPQEHLAIFIFDSQLPLS